MTIENDCFFFIEQEVVKVLFKQKIMKIVMNFHEIWQFEFYVIFFQL